MSITIIIVGYNSERWLRPCLDSLKRATECRPHLCFVDNHNNPSIDLYDLRWADLELIKTPSPMGFAAANNFALRASRRIREFVVLLNQDTVSTCGWIDECVNFMKGDPQLGAVSPGLRTYDLSDWEPNLTSCLAQSGKSVADLSNEITFVESVTAAAVVVRYDCLKEVGPFDTLFGSYFEDYDLFRRMRAAGYLIAVVPNAVVGHFCGSAAQSVQARRGRERLLLRNRLIHEVRITRSPRWVVVIQYMAWRLPRRFSRDVFRKASIKDGLVSVMAFLDLLSIMPRLLNRRLDRNLFEKSVGLSPRGDK